MEDFSTEHLGVTIPAEKNDGEECYQNLWPERMKGVIEALNVARGFYIRETDPELKKDYWWQMIQLLPSSYNQTRNVMMNYEVLCNIYKSRKSHRLNEWVEFCQWIESLPYHELICGPDFNIPEETIDKFNSIGNPNPLTPEEIKEAINKKDLVQITRCKDCKYYISAEDMKNDSTYKYYKSVLDHDGLCTCTYKWTDKIGFCSDAIEKED